MVRRDQTKIKSAPRAYNKLRAPARTHEVFRVPLIDLDLPADRPDPPGNVCRFIREADRRIAEFQRLTPVSAFVPSDYTAVYGVLAALADGTLMRGSTFCEWGSGFGAVADLAAWLGFAAHGIEADGELVAEARQLATDYALDVEFAHGSFIPPGGEARIHTAGRYSWFVTEADYAYEELGLDPDDFDLVFAYPWPDEEEITSDLFERYAGPGAVLLTYHGGHDFRLRRKAARRRGKLRK
jgi:hypothetical protein